MNLTVAKRYRDIRHIRINSLMICNEQAGHSYVGVDFESSVRLVPFISRFSLLEKVSFGARSTVPGSSIGDNFAPIHGYFDDDESEVEELGMEAGVGGEGGGNYQRMMTTIDSISAAFRIGGLPNDLVVSGLCCPKARYRSVHNMPTTQCDTCLRVCRSFPLASVLGLECMGSSRDKVQAKRPYSLDICLSREQIEFIVATRPGGTTMLQSNSRILQLLSKG